MNTEIAIAKAQKMAEARIQADRGKEIHTDTDEDEEDSGHDHPQQQHYHAMAPAPAPAPAPQAVHDNPIQPLDHSVKRKLSQIKEEREQFEETVKHAMSGTWEEPLPEGATTPDRRSRRARQD